MPKLKFLDSTSVKEQEKREAKRKGPFLKVVRPSEKQLISVCLLYSIYNSVCSY